MNKELKGKLDTALQNAGFDKGQLAFINISKEEEIQGVIDNLKRLKTPPISIEEQLKQAEIQSEIDRRITEAKKKWEEGKQNPPTPPIPKEGLTAEAISKMVADAVAATNAPLLEKLNGFEQSRTREGRLAQARNALSQSNIPEKNRDFYLELYNPDSDKPITEWVKSAEEKHESYVQSLVDGGGLSKPPAIFKGSAEISEDEAQAIADSVKV